jgi:Pentapeptide repeats (8 copies)/NACHT domain
MAEMWQSAMVNRARRPGRRHLLAAVRHPAQRDGVIALVLLLLPWAALVQIRRHDLDPGTMAAVIFGLAAVSIGLATLWVTWAAYRGPGRSGGLGLAEIADQLAIAVGAQWEAEARVRRLNDPYPLPVSWDAAGQSMTDSWDSLVKLAASGAGWPAPPPAGTWAASLDGLKGESGELVDVLDRVPTGRLIVLGEPGAGKTLLMVRLILDLLVRRLDGSPVPLLVSIASWNPVKQDLRDWLGTQLTSAHPALASAPPLGVVERTQAAALLAAGLIMPVLDGLDEIPEQVRGPAISRINDAIRPGEHLMVTCRTRQYRDAVRPDEGIEVTLRGAAAIELRPLGAEAVRGYLGDDAAGPQARARWEPVFSVLGTETPVGLALSTPLMVGLARAIYNPRPGELGVTLRDPAELLDTALADEAAVESLLFDAFIPAAYRPNPAARWTAQQAERWLIFLARNLEYKIGGTDLAWWQLRLAAPHATSTVIAGFTAALWLVISAVAKSDFTATFGGVLGFPVIAWLLAELLARLTGLRFPSRGFRWRWPRLPSGRYRYLYRVIAVVIFIYPVPVIPGVVLFFLFGLKDAVVEIDKSVSPEIVFRNDRRVAIAAWLVTGSLPGLLLGSLFYALGSLREGLAIGLWITAFFGSICATLVARWPFYCFAHVWLAFKRHVPWSFMEFLADAHQRGILRQTGAVYQFRHIELQHRLGGYTRAIGQLGSDDLAVRIDAIDALERAARDSARDRPKVAEVLAAFIREYPNGLWPSLGPAGLEQARPALPDLQAAITVIGRQLRSEIGPLDLTGANLTGADLAQLNLTGANLTATNLYGADLANANLTGAVLTRANLTKANLQGARLLQTNLTGANLSGADLAYASLNGAVLTGADLNGANATSADLRDADLTDTDLAEARLKGARWPQDAAVPQGWKLDTSSGLRRAPRRLRR